MKIFRKKLVVPQGFSCTLKGYRKLVNFIKPEYLHQYKDFQDQDIDDMIKVEKKLSRKY